MTGARRKKTRTQPNLSAERVRDEALKLIEAEGVEGFSTRKLGRALGVEAMAIYWYYPSKDALLDAVVEAMVSQIGQAPDAKPEDGPTDFIDALRKLAQAYRGLAHKYPNAFQLMATRRFATEGSYRFLEGIFTLAERHGLTPKMTARFYRVVSSYVSGIALSELAWVRENETWQAANEARARMPRVAGVFEFIGPQHYDDVFDFGLDVILAPLIEQTGVGAKSTKKRTASRKKSA